MGCITSSLGQIKLSVGLLNLQNWCEEVMQIKLVSIPSFCEVVTSSIHYTFLYSYRTATHSSQLTVGMLITYTLHVLPGDGRAGCAATCAQAEGQPTFHLSH